MIRRSTNADGLALKALARMGGVLDVDALDWSHIEDGWLVADFHGVLVGALQLCPGRPIFRVEFLLVSPSLSKVRRALVTKALCYTARSVAVAYGASALYSIIQKDQRSFMDILRRRGCERIDEGIMYRMLL